MILKWKTEEASRIVEQMKPEGGVTCVRVLCNSCLNPLDVQTARAAKWGMHREWCTSLLQGSGEGGSEVPGDCFPLDTNGTIAYIPS